MSETVVVVQPSAPSAPSAPTPDAPAAEIVEVIHDDARDLGYALARIDQHSIDLAELTGRVVSLESIASAQAQATAAIVEAVEETAETVEEIRDEVTTDETVVDDTFTPEPDTSPGKTHWLRRSGKEWRGKE